MGLHSLGVFVLSCESDGKLVLCYTSADGNWAAYSPYTTCTAICGGGGVQVRSRLCQFAGPYGKQVCTRPGEETTDYKPCNLQACTGALGEYGQLEKDDALMFF